MHTVMHAAAPFLLFLPFQPPLMQPHYQHSSPAEETLSSQFHKFLEGLRIKKKGWLMLIYLTPPSLKLTFLFVDFTRVALHYSQIKITLLYVIVLVCGFMCAYFGFAGY